MREKRAVLPLLLLADPCEEMIDRYLMSGRLFVMQENELPVCVAVIASISDTVCELKNLATDERCQNQGYATAMLRYLFAYFRRQCDRMLVGTSQKGTTFYKRFGFVYHHTVPAFFTRQYPVPIYEDGIQCVDMLYLQKKLRE